MATAPAGNQKVFPAPAGMNRLAGALAEDQLRVPRASGDEPRAMAPGDGTVGCSPRQRG